MKGIAALLFTFDSSAWTCSCAVMSGKERIVNFIEQLRGGSRKLTFVAPNAFDRLWNKLEYQTKDIS